MSFSSFFQPKVRYTDTSYIISQQWEKGREKNTFPNVYAYEYNRQKFENLAKCDEKQSIAIPNLPIVAAKIRKRPLPVPPPLPPPLPPAKSNDEPIKNEEIVATAETTSTTDRKQRKRRTKSLERIRDQTTEIELSDSDEEIVNKVPIITATDLTHDEPDASVASVTITDTIIVNSNNTTGGDEPAICVDTVVVCNDGTFSDRSQISFDEILKIEESLDEEATDLNEIGQSIVVDIHDEPTIELKIHEEGDSDKEVPQPQRNNGFTKEFQNNNDEIDQERCQSEDDTIGREVHDKPERLVQSDSEILEKTPIELVVECDINENVILSDSKTKVIDYNHNDVVKSTLDDVCANDNETNSIIENREIIPAIQPSIPHGSISTRSSYNGSDTEPMYATVDTALQMVSN